MQETKSNEGATAPSIIVRTLRIDVPLHFDGTVYSEKQVDDFVEQYKIELQTLIEGSFKWRDKKIKEIEAAESALDPNTPFNSASKNAVKSSLNRRKQSPTNP